MQFNIKMHTLAGVVSGLTAHAAAPKVNRPNLHAVQFELNADQSLTIAATDTYTLAIADINTGCVSEAQGTVNAGVGECANVNVHALAKVVKQLSGKQNEWITIHTNGEKMLVANGVSSSWLDLMPNQFPKWRESVPASEQFTQSITGLNVNPDTLAKLAKLSPTDKISKPHFKLRFKGVNQPMLFTRTDEDLAWRVYVMPVPTKDGN